MDEGVDVAIVGAGPYGLSVGAHLRGTGVRFREFGRVMQPWRTAMPRGMFLQSQGFASNLSDPAGAHTLAAFCLATGRAYADHGLPVPLTTFIAYGEWFQAELVPHVEETTVTRVACSDGGFTVSLATGEDFFARQVVIATGIGHFAYVPDELAALPSSACTHSSAHVDLSVFCGRQVVVIGAGQSALETAALLSEHGAAPQIVMRRRQPVWNSPPLPRGRPLYQRLHEPEAGLGSGWATWFYSRHPELFRYLPRGSRGYGARTALDPAGESWLRARVEGAVPILGGRSLCWAEAGPARVRLGIAGEDGKVAELSADHVISATGYRPDLRLLTFLDEGLRRRLRTLAGTPAVGVDYQSSVPGLYFAGPGVEPTFGPVMRSVYGAAHAARTIAPRLAATARRRPTATYRAAVPAGRRR